MRLFALAIIAAVTLTGQSLAGELKKLLEPSDLVVLTGEVVVLDIRSPAQYALGHVDGARNAPYPTWRGPKNNPGLPLTDVALT